MDRRGQGTASPPVHLIQQPIPQQPEVTILQQLPWATSVPPISSKAGHIREDLMDLMMIQNAQMHQVIMNNLAMSAVAHFENSPAQSLAQVSHVPWQIEDEEEDDPAPLVFHHHYAPYPSILPFMGWQSPSRVQQQPAIRHVGPDLQLMGRQDREPVPPPPPPSATGTVMADVPPASVGARALAGRTCRKKTQLLIPLHPTAVQRERLNLSLTW
ncbi:proline-rich protein 29 isoform X3 [Podarcis muralis]